MEQEGSLLRLQDSCPEQDKSMSYLPTLFFLKDWFYYFSIYT